MKPKLTIYSREVPSREPRVDFSGRDMSEGLAGAERAHLSAGVESLTKGNIPDAIESFLKVLNINQKNPEACLFMGILCKRMRDYNDAIRYLDQAIKSDPANSEAYMERGLAILEKRSGLWTDANAALVDFSSAFLLNPNEVRALYFMGVCKHRMMDYTDALALFERYGELVPVDILAARELEIYRCKTRYLMHYSEMSMLYGRNIYS